jgi:hypothetical protein
MTAPSAPLEVRVTLLDTWEEITLRIPSSTLISELKRTVLARSRIRRPPAEYVVKYKGAELDEAGKTLADAGVAPNGSLIVLSRRRVPAR